MNILRHLRVLAQSASRLTAAAESFGAMQLEQKVSIIMLIILLLLILLFIISIFIIILFIVITIIIIFIILSSLAGKY